MSEWREVALGEGIEVLHGYAFKGEYFRDEGDLIVLTPGNFWDEGGFKPKSGKEKYYDGPFPPRFLLSQGDVVIAMTEQVHGLLGSSATIPTDGVYLHNQRIGRVQVTDPDALDLRFVYHLMNTRTIRQQIQATATGSKVRHTAPERIKAVRADIPDIAVQRRVASILDSIDDLIDNNRRRVEVLEEMARAVYREWFVRFRYPGHEHVPLVDSPLGPIPDGWTVGVLGDLAALDRVNIQPRDSPGELFDHYSIPAFDDGARPVVEPGGAIKSGKYLLSTPAVLVSKLNPRIDRVWFAEPGTEQRSVTSTEFLILRPNERSHLEHLYLLARDPKFREQLTALSGGTSGSHQRAKPAAFLKLPVAVAPAAVLDILAKATSDQLRLARQLARQGNKLAGLRDLLLPKLVTGQIDVSHLDLDVLAEAATA